MVGVEVAAAAGWPLAALGAAGVLGLHWRLVAHAVRVAEASHELRGPLTTARLALEGLGGDARRSAAIELELRRAGLALEDLTGAAPGARPAHVDVGALAADAVESWRGLAAAFGTELALDVPHGLLVHADPLRLAQAYGNLVGNAVEHGGGTVRVRASGAGAGASVRVEVSDEGPGLPAAVAAALAPRAGGRLGRVRRRLGLVSTRVSPRGHGLTIAARVAGQHGGRLTAEPATRGARLVLELPAAR